MEELMPLILELLQGLLLLAVSTGVGALIIFVRKNTTAKQQDIIEEIVRIAVLYVQQTNFDKMGQEKLELAKIRVRELLKRKGVDISEKQIETMIEAMVKQAKKEFGENW